MHGVISKIGCHNIQCYTYTMTLVIGFDAEWVYLPNENTNHILSYQFCVKSEVGTRSDIIFTKSPQRKHRLALKDLIGRAIEAGKDAGVVDRGWPPIST